MTDRNLDIVASHDPDDTAFTPFATLLSRRFRTGDARIARNVPDMVRIIGSTLGSGGHLRRLRIFGHGDVTGAFTLDMRDTLCVIAGRVDPHDHDDIQVTNDPPLRDLKERFAPGGWVELHGCRVGQGVPGEELLRALALLWSGASSPGIRFGLPEADSRVECASDTPTVPSTIVDSRSASRCRSSGP